MSIIAEITGGKLSSLKNPFSKDNITQVTTLSYKGFNGAWMFSGRVCFENGNTKGEQTINGTSFNDVIKQMEEFVKSI